MIKQWSHRYHAKAWPSTKDSGNFVWSHKNIILFGHLVASDTSAISSFPNEWLFKGAPLGRSLWENVHIWWTKHPEHFTLFWIQVQIKVHHKWSAHALNVIAKHAPEKDKAYLINTATAGEEGRLWLLSSPEYKHYLCTMNNLQLMAWVEPTTYSMQHLEENFAYLQMLLDLLGENRALLLSSLQDHLHQTDRIDLKTLAGQAWLLNDLDLNRWMDQDKSLPFWFDPVNRNSWMHHFNRWKNLYDGARNLSV